MEDMTILYQGLSTLDTIHNFFKLLIASFHGKEGFGSQQWQQW